MTFNFVDKSLTYTKAEEKIMDFIENNTDDFLFMNIGQVAKTLGVSDATVSRFAKHIGCKDFKDLKIKVKNENKSGGAAKKMSEALLKSDGFNIDHWIELQKGYIDKTRELIETSELEKMVEFISEADRVFIHGKNASSSLAQLMMFRLRRMGINVSMIPSGGSEIVEGIASAKEGDVIITFCLSKISKESKMILSYGREAGYKTVVFSGKKYRNEEEKADANIFVYRGEEDEYHSMTTPVIIIDAVILAVYEKISKKAEETLNNIHILKKKYKK